MASSIKADMQGMQNYLNASKASLNADQHEKLMSQQFEFFMGRLESCTMRPEDAAPLDELIRNGPWTASQREKLCGSIAAKVSVTLNDKTSRRKQQEMQFWGAYSTQEELDRDKDPNFPTDDKLQRLANRMNKIGLLNPHEAAYKNIMVTWLANAKFAVPPTPEDCRSWLLRLKNLMEGKRKAPHTPDAGQRILDYPSVPRSSWFEGESDPVSAFPTAAQMTEWGSMLALRSTSRVLRQTSPPALSLNPQANMNTAMMNLTSI